MQAFGEYDAKTATADLTQVEKDLKTLDFNEKKTKDTMWKHANNIVSELDKIVDKEGPQFEAAKKKYEDTLEQIISKMKENESDIIPALRERNRDNWQIKNLIDYIGHKLGHDMPLYKNRKNKNAIERSKGKYFPGKGTIPK